MHTSGSPRVGARWALGIVVLFMVAHRALCYTYKLCLRQNGYLSDVKCPPSARFKSRASRYLLHASTIDKKEVVSEDNDDIPKKGDIITFGDIKVTLGEYFSFSIDVQKLIIVWDNNIIKGNIV